MTNQQKQQILKSLIYARRILRDNHLGNFYVERAEIDRAICTLLCLDYENVKTIDFETAIKDRGES